MGYNILESDNNPILIIPCNYSQEEKLAITTFFSVYFKHQVTSNALEFQMNEPSGICEKRERSERVYKFTKLLSLGFTSKSNRERAMYNLPLSTYMLTGKMNNIMITLQWINTILHHRTIGLVAV
ncbi:hypothetical protein ACOSQ4_027422 [Xanthoceras sorbifolium]